MGLGVEKVGGQVSHGSKVGGGHRALAHACEGAAARHAAVRAPRWRLPMALLPLPLPMPLWPAQPPSINQGLQRCQADEAPQIKSVQAHS